MDQRVAPGGRPAGETGAMKWHVTAATIVLLLACWVSSGTMAPYAATHATPIVLLPCGELANIDHFFFWQPFLIFQDVPDAQWQSAMLLRRILYPLLAWPLVSAFGFEVGGFIANILLLLVAAAFFYRYLHQTAGSRAVIVAAWLLATYPGISYWVGLPYSYAVIVPGMLLGGMCLAMLAEEPGSHRRVFLLTCAMGLLFTAYDGLLMFLGPAVVWILLRNRRPTMLPTALAGLLGPVLLTLAVLQWGLGAQLLNSNSRTYTVILKSYLEAPDLWSQMIQRLAELPLLAGKLFFFSNFFFLPTAFLFMVLLARPIRGGRGIALAGEALLLTTLALFLFLNMAPAYPGWQMRGEWIARIYQPVFVAYLMWIAVWMARLEHDTANPVRRGIAGFLVGVTVLANGVVVFGGLIASPMTDVAYRNFYQHGKPHQYTENLRRHGARPLGVCRGPRMDPPGSGGA